MNVPRYSALAARLLQRPAVPPRTPSVEDRARSIATMERARSARRGRRAAARWAVALGGLAAASAIWFALQAVSSRPHATGATGTGTIELIASPRGLGASVSSPQGAAPLRAGARLEPGSRIETASGGGAVLRLFTGTELELESGSRFSVHSHGSVEQFMLGSGVLKAHVAKLRAGDRFIVATPDAEIEVRGTRFQLKVLPVAEACSGSRTRLVVSEGAVDVRAGAESVRVLAGGAWPAPCGNADARPHEPGIGPARAEPSTRTEPRDTSPEAEPARAQGSSPRLEPAEASMRRSLLTEQNDLFADALVARKRGDIDAALRAYAHLLARHPRSALAENARIERMRLLSTRNSSTAKSEAALYLEQYPKGFARDEARGLLAEQ